MLEIIGDSHVIALFDATKLAAFSSRHGQIRMAQLGHGYNFLEPFFSTQPDGVSFTQGIAKAQFKRVNPDGADMIKRNDPRRFVFMFGLYPSFGFDQKHWMDHTVALWSRDRHFVSASAFDIIIDETLKEPMSFFETLSGMNVRFSVASCCPVPASYPILARKTNFAEHEIAFIYNRFRNRATERLTKLGIVCHHPPSEVYNEHGEMHDIYARQPGDYHANPQYGRLMLEKILSELEDQA